LPIPTLARAIAALTISLLLAACGGGGAPAPSAPAARAPQSAGLPLAASPRTPTATALMDWAQAAYPDLFPGRQGNISAGGYLYRYYPETRNYVGVAGEAVYLMGPVSGGPLLQVGSLGDFTCPVYPDSCNPAAGDTRNGTYTAYATTGERFSLTLDFDTRQYSIGSPQTTVAALDASGAFTDDTVAGSYLFGGSAGTGATTGFRYVDDLIVGAFPVAGGARPFVATRNVAQSIAEAAGSYSNFGINHANGTDDSRIYTSRIDAGAATMQICTDFGIYEIAQCPAASVINYPLTLNGDLFTATATPAGTADTFSFRVAKAGNENIFLMGAINYTTGARYFRLGLAESGAFTAGSARGGTTLGEWGTANFTTTSYTSTGIAQDGQAISLTGSLTTMGVIGPTGMRGFQGTANGFAMQNSQLAVLLGARNGPAAGYMQIGSK